ncbi:MAG: cyclic nucleotide-binding domain-containing protein [Melioribacteraceae bacterium]|nr:cyclic nucleotide-binding domain-containing protein [Melioribacteraceae bacterium]MCF8352989.1 cyclic nucleotide-binding domain-containing protein [Melioribacteraceae bacterium]MCF8392880.1 cyclic nucleotide-binding domain-containing protein [Melioribacteraceae bacterium]MCF8417826.1 cyclic nucleotide-binding domain-containing protein [Melioribacteraceae bacterium]
MIRKRDLSFFAWDLLVTICTSFLTIFIPLDFIFNLKIYDYYSTLMIATTVVFFLDIFVNIYKYKTSETSFSFEDESGLKSYFKKWFLIDLIAVIPVDIFIHPSPFQLIRLVKLVKVAKFMMHLKSKEVQYSNILTIIFFMFWIPHITHWVACGWLWLRGIDHTVTDVTNYINALYWTVTTLTTVGYGDITPLNNNQTIYAMCVEVLGVGVYGYIIGNIAGIISKKDPSKAKYSENMENLAALVQYRQIPFTLQQRIRDYYTYMYRKRLGYDESSFLEGLPKSLKTEVSLILKKEVIEKIELFKDADDNYKREVALHLKPIVLTPGDSVFNEGDQGNEMYFVVKGQLSVLVDKETKQIATLHDGDFFGEIALFLNKPRTATIKALTYCDLYSLNQKAFDLVVSKYPDIKRKIEAKVILREEK